MRERVVVNGLQLCRPGMTVEPKLVDMPTSAVSSHEPDSQTQKIPVRFTRRPARARDCGHKALRSCRHSGSHIMMAPFSSTAPSWPGSFPSSSSCWAFISASGRRSPSIRRLRRPPSRSQPTTLGEREGRCRDGGCAGGAADQRSRRHAVHVVAKQQRRLVQPDVTFALGTDVNMAQVLVQNRVAIAEPLPDVVSHRRDGEKAFAGHSSRGRALFGRQSETGQPYYDKLYMSNYATIQLMDALAR